MVAEVKAEIVLENALGLFYTKLFFRWSQNQNSPNYGNGSSEKTRIKFVYTVRIWVVLLIFPPVAYRLYYDTYYLGTPKWGPNL